MAKTGKYVSDSPKRLFVFRFCFRGKPQGLHAPPPILIVADWIEEANELIKKEGNLLADENRNGTGYKCKQKIVLDRDMNLNLEIE